MTVTNSAESHWQQRDLGLRDAVKNCYRWHEGSGALPQNDSAIGITDLARNPRDSTSTEERPPVQMIAGADTLSSPGPLA